jgi:hypothetical protein
MRSSICENIRFNRLFIDNGKNTIRLYTTFEHCDYHYDACFTFSRSSKFWKLNEIFHTNYSACLNCMEYCSDDYNDFDCRYLERYKEEIREKILDDPIVSEKIRNFRLEAITAGFNY